MKKITVIDIQHRSFKKAIQGYDRVEVDQFLDDIIETLEDEGQERASLEAEISDLRERISHFKAMEESLQNTLLLAQRTADEVKASAHKEADLIKAAARMGVEREIATFGDRLEESRREFQRMRERVEKVKGELRGMLMTHMALLDRPHEATEFTIPIVRANEPPDELPAQPTPAIAAAAAAHAD